MSTIMTRGGAETWVGKKLPKDVAYLVMENFDREWRSVTWKEIFEKRKQEQLQLTEEPSLSHDSGNVYLINP